MNLKNYLANIGISISDFSRNCGLPYSTIAELISGKKTLSKCNASTVYVIAKELGISVEELLEKEKEDIYPDKYSLDQKSVVFLAKRLWDQNVYCGMKMENRNITFPQTKTILEGINVSGVSLDDITAVLNMRDAWKYILNTLDNSFDLEYIMKINSFISRNESLEWGVLRRCRVEISGTDYIPPIPEKNDVIKGVNKILLSYKTNTEKALDMFCFITYRQLFWDGNKRTALCCANKMLLSSGAGMITIKDDVMIRFNELLCRMYDTGEKEEVKTFLYNNAIFGLD